MYSRKSKKGKSSDIAISTLDELLEKIGQKPDDFYKKIGEALTPQERMYIIQRLENKSCMSCVNGSCRVPYHEKVRFDVIDRPAGFQCLGWMNHAIVGKSKVLQINDVRRLQ